MAEVAAALQNTDLFFDLPQEVIRQELLPHGYLQEYQRGQFLIMPQQKVERFGIVLRGKVHILHIFADGSQSLMSDVTPGETVGTDLVCTRSQISPYHAMAAVQTQVFYLPIHILTRSGILSEDVRQRILSHLLTLISNENMKKEYRLAILSQKGLRERIMTYLVMQANRLRRQTFAVSFSREEMASFLCVNRSALSHELSLMEQEGLISFRKNVFTLHGWELERGAGTQYEQGGGNRHTQKLPPPRHNPGRHHRAEEAETNGL